MYSFPEHIKKAVEQYAVLTNVEPNVHGRAQAETRLRPTKESYPLEKAVFVPRELINKHGCGTLNITKDDIKQIMEDYYSIYGDNTYEYLCDKPPGNI